MDRRAFLGLIAAAAGAAAVGAVVPKVLQSGDRGAAAVLHISDLFHPHHDPDDHFDLAAVSARAAVLGGVVLDGDGGDTGNGRVPIRQMQSITGQTYPTVAGARGAATASDPTKLLELLERQPSWSVLNVGALTDLAAALETDRKFVTERVAKVLVFAGEASPNGYVEHNVAYDPEAYVRVMTSGLPIRWIPCFDGGIWSNAGLASWVRVPQLPLFASARDPVKRFFTYAFRKLDPQAADPIAYLEVPHPPEDDEVLADAGEGSGERNLWCGALVDLLETNEIRWRGSQVARMESAEVAFSDDGAVSRRGRPVQLERFVVTSPEGYQGWMQDRLTQLLARL